MNETSWRGRAPVVTSQLAETLFDFICMATKFSGQPGLGLTLCTASSWVGWPHPVCCLVPPSLPVAGVTSPSRRVSQSRSLLAADPHYSLLPNARRKPLLTPATKYHHRFHQLQQHHLKHHRQKPNRQLYQAHEYKRQSPNTIKIPINNTSSKFERVR